MSRASKKSELYGITRKQVERIIACLDQGCSDEELAMRIRQVRVPFESWKAAIPAEHIERILCVKKAHGGRKIEASTSRRN